MRFSLVGPKDVGTLAFAVDGRELLSPSAANCPKSRLILMLPRLSTQRAMLTASLLVLTGCVIGGATAIAPPERDIDDDDEISVSESPALGNTPDVPEEGEDDADGAAGNDASAAAPEPCDGGLCRELPEGCTSAQREGHVYVFCGERLAWGAARTSCHELDLDLVIIESAAENAFVASHVQANSWIGASDQATEGSFAWVTPGADPSGSPVTFTSWAPAVPDNCGGLFGQQDCVRLSQDGAWDDSDCNGGCFEGTFAFVCESY